MRVLVVGAGIVGMAVADELLRRGVEVELFERNSEVGCESSWAAAGLLSPPSEAEGPGPFLELLLLGHQLIPEVVTRLTALTGVDVQYRASGMLDLAFSDSDVRELDQKLVWQQQVHLQLERVDRNQILQVEKVVNGSVRCGIWYPGTAQVDSPRLMQAYRKMVEIQGGVIRTQVPVRRFLLKGERVAGVETSQGDLQADAVVNCAGAWAGFDEVCPLKIPAMPVKGQILQFNTPSPFIRTVLKTPKGYLVQRDAHKLLAGTTVEYVGYDKQVTSEATQSILTQVRQIAPAAAAFPVETAWAGLRPGTPDRLPILGPTPLKGLWVATGHFRNGILLGPLTGRLLADSILGAPTCVDLKPFRIERFLAREN